MMLVRWGPFLALWSTFILFVTAWHDPVKDQYCFEGCQETFSGLSVAFGGNVSLEDGYYLYTCSNELFVQSVYLCGRVYCSEEQITAGAEYAASQCVGNSYYNDTTLGMIMAMSDSDVAQVPRFSFDDMEMFAIEIVNTTLIPDAELYELGFHTLAAYYDGREVHLWYSYAMFIFWGILISFGVCNNVLSSLYSYRSSAPTTHGPVKITQSLTRLVRSRLTLPPTFKRRCNVPLWQCTLPPRAESVVIAAFVCLNVVLCAVSCDIFEMNLYWADERLQIWRYFSDRTGYLAYTNLAICWLFGIRNNILLWMTGWSFATFNRFHRWVARVATLQAVLHSIGYSVYSVIDGGYEEFYADFLEQYWYTGVLATCAMSLMLGFSILYLRIKVYDLFLLVHIGLALVTLVSLFYHTSIFLGDFDGWLWACVAFWVFDRMCRYSRVIYLTILRRGFASEAELDDDARLIRIDITSACIKGKGTDSGYFFLYSPLMWWESHPFTVVHWKSDGEVMPRPQSDKSSVPVNSKLPSTVTSVASATDSVGNYCLLIRPYGGYTARLRRSLLGPEGRQRRNFLLEGPYGHRPSLEQYNEVWFFMGGSGVSVAINGIYDLLNRSPSTKAHLIWSSRSAEFIDSLMGRELAMAVKQENVAVDVFLTGSKQELRTASNCHSVRFHRPNLPEMMRHVADNQIGPLAVVVCGPASMTDDVRVAFCTEQSSHKQHMELFIESFNW